MKILGDIRPYTNRRYNYTMVNNAGKPIKVNLWQIYFRDRLLMETKTAVFKFDIKMANLNLKLVAKVRDHKTDKLVDYYMNIQPLAGKPRILDLYWQDANGAKIQKREVAYLDKVTLVVKTKNIPQGDTLKITIYEDEYEEGHGDSSRNMGEYYTTGISKYGYAYLELNNMSLYHKKLNSMDYVNEDTHEFYARVHYANKLDKIKDGIQLKVRNALYKTLPDTDLPVVVVTAKRKKEKKKTKVNATFNMFFDGTLNNMNNTTKRIKKETTNKDASYLNFYTNVALLYMTLIDVETDHIYNIYTEGVGTLDNHDDGSVSPGLGYGGGRGVEDKIERGIAQMKEKRELFITRKNKEVEKATINVFGFSRGAAEARRFINKFPSHIAMALRMESTENIIFNFVGLFDTVASYGFNHTDDVWELGLKLGGTPNKIIQLVAADEYRDNFNLTNIASSVKAGVGYQLTIPGAHADIGGGYSESEDEIRVFKYQIFNTTSTYDQVIMKQIHKEYEKLRSQYISEGWYTDDQIKIVDNFYHYNTMLFNKKELVGTRRGIRITYQYIPFEIMRKFSEKYAKISFDKDLIKKNYTISSDLSATRNFLVNYAMSHDGSNFSTITLPHKELKWLRNKYLHRSTNDTHWAMIGRYDDKGNPDREILEG